MKIRNSSMNYLFLIASILLSNRALFFCIAVFIYTTGGFSTSEILSILVMYIPSTLLIFSFIILTPEEVTIKKKKTTDYSFFIIVLFVNIYIINMKSMGEITLSTTITLLTCVECLLDVYISKRLFIDRSKQY